MSGTVQTRVVWTALAVACAILCGPLSAEAKPRLVDRIVAVVDDHIVLQSDVMTQIAVETMRRDLDRRNLTEERIREMFGGILEHMVQDKLLLARAREDSIEVDSEVVEELVRQEMGRLKAEHGEESLREKLLAEGLSEREIREQLRQKYRQDYLRRRMYEGLRQKVEVSYLDVEAFRSQYRDELPPLVNVSHILIKQELSPERKAEVRKRAESLLERIRNGEDFRELATQHSDDPGSAPDGGDLGYFSRGVMVPEFEAVAFRLEPGEVSDVVETPLGFHIIRVDAVSGDEVRARHILISLRTSEADAAEAHGKAEALYERIQAGEDFAEVAKAHSAHEESAEMGGRLGAYPLEGLPPAFAGVIRGMHLGEVSEPVQTEFGWHLVKLGDDRDAIEDILMTLRVQEQFKKLLAETREKLYVEVRGLEP